jgi:hypothetical protein
MLRLSLHACDSVDGKQSLVCHTLLLCVTKQCVSHRHRPCCDRLFVDMVPTRCADWLQTLIATNRLIGVYAECCAFDLASNVDCRPLRLTQKSYMSWNAISVGGSFVSIAAMR